MNIKGPSETLSLELKVGQEVMGGAAPGQRAPGGDLTPGASLSSFLLAPIGGDTCQRSIANSGGWTGLLRDGGQAQVLNTDFRFPARSPISVCAIQSFKECWGRYPCEPVFRLHQNPAPFSKRSR